jgi:hypothetical protein
VTCNSEIRARSVSYPVYTVRQMRRCIGSRPYSLCDKRDCCFSLELGGRCTSPSRSQNLRRLAAERAEEENRRANEEAAGRWHAKVKPEQDTKRAEDEATLEAELAPERERLQREWLAAHPGKAVADFLRHAWPGLRQNIIEARRQAELDAIQRQFHASGMYSL